MSIGNQINSVIEAVRYLIVSTNNNQGVMLNFAEGIPKGITASVAPIQVKAFAGFLAEDPVQRTPWEKRAQDDTVVIPWEKELEADGSATK